MEGLVRINFEAFDKQLSENREANNEYKRVFLHFEGVSNFYFYLKTRDFWVLECVLNKESLPVSPSLEGDVVEDFRVNYLYDSIMIDKPLSKIEVEKTVETEDTTEVVMEE